MIISVDRNSGLFKPDVCDVINIKSTQLHNTIEKINAPPILKKEDVMPMIVTFPTDEELTFSETFIPELGALVQSTVKLGKPENYSFRIGRINIISVTFIVKEAFSVIRAVGQDPYILPYAIMKKYHDIFTLDRVPAVDFHTTAIPLKLEVSEESFTSSLLVKIPKSSPTASVKGLFAPLTILPIYGYFIE